MSKLEEREARRKQSIVGSMIQEPEAAEKTPAEEKPKKRAAKRKGTPPESGENKDRVQRSYWIDKDVEKALKRKALEEDKSLTEAANEAMRRGLEEYL